MKNVNLSSVASNSNRLEAGGYVLVIKNVEDRPMNSTTGKGDYLQIEYDINEGPFKGYYTDMYSSLGFWGGHFIRSYKPKALGMFKEFIRELRHDNPDFKWDDDAENDEKSMIGCQFGAVLGEEEYRGNDGSLKTRLNVAKITTVSNIRTGKYNVPDPKTLSGAPKASGVVDTTADSMEQINADIPF